MRVKKKADSKLAEDESVSIYRTKSLPADQVTVERECNSNTSLYYSRSQIEFNCRPFRYSSCCEDASSVIETVTPVETSDPFYSKRQWLRLVDEGIPVHQCCNSSDCALKNHANEIQIEPLYFRFEPERIYSSKAVRRLSTIREDTSEDESKQNPCK